MTIKQVSGADGYQNVQQEPSVSKSPAQTSSTPAKQTEQDLRGRKVTQDKQGQGSINSVAKSALAVAQPVTQQHSATISNMASDSNLLKAHEELFSKLNLAQLEQRNKKFGELMKACQEKPDVSNFVQINQELDAAYAEALSVESFLQIDPIYSQQYEQYRADLGRLFSPSDMLKTSSLDHMAQIRTEVDKLLAGQTPSTQQSLHLQNELEKICQYNCYATQYTKNEPELELIKGQVEQCSRDLLQVNSFLSVENTTHPSNLQPAAGTSGPTGLENFGNTCWMNSSLQALKASGLMEKLVQRVGSDQEWVRNHKNYQSLSLMVANKQMKQEELDNLHLPENIDKFLDKYKENPLRGLLFSLRDDYAIYKALERQGAYTALRTINDALDDPQYDKEKLSGSLLTLSTAIRNVKNMSGSDWRLNQQQDAEEFVTLLVSSLNYNPTSMGSISECVHAKEKHTVTNPVETTSACQMSFITPTNDLQTLFDQNFSFQSSNNTLKFEVNGKQVTSDTPGFDKKYHLTHAPDILPLQMKRFGYDMQMRTTNKNDNVVGLKADKKGNFHLNAAAAFQDKPKSVPYLVNSFVVHQGSSVRGGHYISFYRKDDQWYYASDTTVRKADINEVKQGLSHAYLIFLKKE